MDRPLMLGDIVIKRYGPKRGQLGYCENVDVHTTIKSLNTNKVLFTSANKLHSKSVRIFHVTKCFYIVSDLLKIIFVL